MPEVAMLWGYNMTKTKSSFLDICNLVKEHSQPIQHCVETAMTESAQGSQRKGV